MKLVRLSLNTGGLLVALVLTCVLAQDSQMTIQNQFWIDEMGIPRAEPLLDHCNAVLEGKKIAPGLKTMLQQEFPNLSKLTPEHSETLTKLFAQPAPGRPYALTAIPPATLHLNADSPTGAVIGSTYKIKQLDGSDFITQTDDFILFIPYTPNFFTKLSVNDSKKSDADFKAELLTQLQQCAQAGDASCETALKLVEAGGFPPAGSKGAELYNQLRQHYTDAGKFNTYNLREVISELTGSELGPKIIKVQPDAFGKFVIEKIPAGFWIVTYSQKVLDYLYVVEIKPDAKTEINLYQPFDHKPYLNLR